MKNNFEKFYLDKSLFCIVVNHSNNYSINHSNNDYFDKIKNICDKTNNTILRKIAQLGLTYTLNKDKLKYLADNYNKINIKKQDIHKFLARLIDNNLISNYIIDKIIIKESPFLMMDEHILIKFFKIISENTFNKKNIDKFIYFFKHMNKKELTLKTNQNIDLLTWHKQLLNN
jgi:hypothetical protein